MTWKEWIHEQGQDHLLEYLNDKLIKQLEDLDRNAGASGLKGYIQRAKDLLKKSCNGVSPFDGCSVEPPRSVINLSFDVSTWSESSLNQTVCVLVAGGLGERLGYHGIKLSLPHDITSGLSFLEFYCMSIRALEGSWLCIMTSEYTDAMTRTMLEENDYYGFDRKKVCILKQERVACFSGVDGRLAVGDDGLLVTKPHGHGDIHFLIYHSGMHHVWQKAGMQQVVFFQDTNPTCFRTIPAALHFIENTPLDMNFIAVPRKAKAAAGAIMHVKSPSQEMTLNVEYNYIEDLLQQNGETDENGDEGYSPYPANTNQFIVRLQSYAKNLEQYQGLVCQEFVNPKYVDSTKSVFKTPTRLECMMQDYAMCLKNPSNVVVTVFSDAPHQPNLTHILYAPAKTSMSEAARLAKVGIPDAGAMSSEFAVYGSNALALRSIGAGIETPRKVSWGGIEQHEWPHIVFYPSFCPKLSRLSQKFENIENVYISSRSTLVVKGSQVVFSGDFYLDGALFIYAHDDAIVNIESLQVRNRGISFIPVNDDDGESLQIRGYKLSEQVVAESTSSVYVLKILYPGIFRFSVDVQAF